METRADYISMWYVLSSAYTVWFGISSGKYRLITKPMWKECHQDFINSEIEKQKRRC